MKQLIDRAYFTASMNGSEMLRRIRARLRDAGIKVVA